MLDHVLDLWLNFPVNSSKFFPLGRLRSALICRLPFAMEYSEMNGPVAMPISRWRGGFSLVEVTIALGVLSFAAVAIIGILPVGLTSMRQSMNQTVEAQIVRSIAAQAVTTSFTNLARTAYYDTDGQPLDGAGGAYYTATITTAPSSYPGSQQSSTITNSLVSLTIQLVAQQNSAAVGTTNTYAIQVANAGK
jgi:uncharacterized protein (TIGR02598 family)